MATATRPALPPRAAVVSERPSEAMDAAAVLRAGAQEAQRAVAHDERGELAEAVRAYLAAVDLCLQGLRGRWPTATGGLQELRLWLTR